MERIPQEEENPNFSMYIFGVGKPKRKILQLLGQENFYMVRELAQALGLSISTTSEHLSWLERHDFVVPSRSSFKYHLLTPKGRALLDKFGSSEIIGTVSKPELLLKNSESEVLELVDRVHNLKYHASWSASEDTCLKMERLCRIDEKFCRGKKRLTYRTAMGSAQFFPKKTVIFQVKSFYCSVEDADRLAVERLTDLVNELMGQFSGLRITNIKLVSSHHALPGHPLAKLAREARICQTGGGVDVDFSEQSKTKDELQGRTPKPEVEHMTAEELAKNIEFMKKVGRDEVAIITPKMFYDQQQAILGTLQAVQGLQEFQQQAIMPLLGEILEKVGGRRPEGVSQWT